MVRALRIIGETGSVSEAARALGISQPAVSKGIAQLEKTVWTGFAHSRGTATRVDRRRAGVGGICPSGRSSARQCTPPFAGCPEGKDRDRPSRVLWIVGLLSYSPTATWGVWPEISWY
ncbi:helix-turn-helix domain-containing protein [Roseibium alexandrii]|uniref:helix-turn-helix domain-containing protein n=1 Tax=Roseibium alexandrii TaxID=388408 RepID=UPI0037529055